MPVKIHHGAWEWDVLHCESITFKMLFPAIGYKLIIRHDLANGGIK